MGLVKVVGYFVLFLGICSILLLVLPGIPPDYEFKSFRITPPKKELLEQLDQNDILDQAELYYEGPHIGIESILELDDGHTIIGSDQSGSIFKVIGKQKAENITHLKFPCAFSSFGGGTKEGGKNECGWPLGMQWDKDGNIILQDYFGGMVKVDLKTGLYDILIPKGLQIDGKVGSVNDLSVGKDGAIYWSDGTTDSDFFSEMLGQPGGRLIKFDPKKKTNQVLLDDIHFSNGVCVSEDDEFVLVSEIGSASIRRYHLKGEKMGTSDNFINGLPGYPDNIRPNGRGGFYVALFNAWNDKFSLRTHLFSERPLLRKFILRLRNLLLGGIAYLQALLPGGNVYLNELEKYILELQPILRIPQRPKTAIVVELSKTGEVLGVFHGKSGKMPNLSQLTAGKEYGYLVCPFDNKIWRIKMESLRQFSSKKVN